MDFLHLNRVDENSVLGAISGRPDKFKPETERKKNMSKIKSKKQFKEQIDAAFETMKTRDEAKACYDFSRDSGVR